MAVINDNLLGAYLKDRRTRLDPASFGFSATRRRTPGLRREEVAQRANVSATWYTWLEQGRGGAPSAAVLDRIARALILTDVEREHIFLLGLGRPPEVHYQATEGVTPRLQGVLDALEFSPSVVRTCTWDVVAWNRAASVVLADYAALPVQQRNVLRLLFGNPQIRERQLDWKSVARFVVAALRADAARAGASNELEALIDEMSRTSSEFVEMWSAHDVRSFGEGTKHVRHTGIGMIAMEYSSFAVDGRPDLSMVIHNPVTREDTDKVRMLIESKESKSISRV